MERIFHEYKKWEDYNAGMYSPNDVIDKHIKVISSIELLSNEVDFYAVCKSVMENWVHSTDVNLSNVSQNRRAWLGAAACMYKNNCPEYLTRIAWSLLNKEAQAKANLVADKIILEYEAKNRTIHKDLGEKMLF